MPRWVARSKISFSIEIFNLDRNLEFFDLWALWERLFRCLLFSLVCLCVSCYDPHVVKEDLLAPLPDVRVCASGLSM